MENLFYIKDLHEHIEGEYSRSIDLIDKKLVQLNQKTVGIVRSRIDQSMYHHITKKLRTDVIWKKLETFVSS